MQNISIEETEEFFIEEDLEFPTKPSRAKRYNKNSSKKINAKKRADNGYLKRNEKRVYKLEDREIRMYFDFRDSKPIPCAGVKKQTTSDSKLLADCKKLCKGEARRAVKEEDRRLTRMINRGILDLEDEEKSRREINQENSVTLECRVYVKAEKANPKARYWAAT